MYDQYLWYDSRRSRVNSRYNRGHRRAARASCILEVVCLLPRGSTASFYPLTVVTSTYELAK